MIRVVGVSIDNDLRDLSRYLWQQGVQHRIIEESGEQVVFVRDRQQVDTVKNLVEDYLSGAFQLRTVEPESAVLGGSDAAIANTLIYKVLRVAVNAPVSSFLTVACLLVALITQLGRAAYRLDFMFYPNLPAANLSGLLGGIDSPLIFIQTLTPMFLHFGELHIIFNLLWLWYFGRQLEAVQSSWSFLLLVILTSFVGNTAQYLYSGASNFGGLSGVVYGLVGYAWVLHNFVPGKRLMVNESLFGVFMIALVLMEILASSWIASAAHFGGLVAGLLAGAAVFVKFRLSSAGGR
jgi:GlpG protein